MMNCMKGSGEIRRIQWTDSHHLVRTQSLLACQSKQYGGSNTSKTVWYWSATNCNFHLERASFSIVSGPTTRPQLASLAISNRFSTTNTCFIFENHPKEDLAPYGQKSLATYDWPTILPFSWHTLVIQRCDLPHSRTVQVYHNCSPA